MNYKRLGKSGLQVSELSYGSWVTFGTQLDVQGAKNLIHRAKDAGVNFFDNAEAYANGVSELIMGEAIKSFRREDIVISTKIFWGGPGPNQTGLSRKHLIEGTKNSLRRLGVEYVDLLFCHRPDPETPIEETVLAMDYLVRQGYALYWGTSEWSAAAIEEAFRIADAYKAIPPTMEQPQYNMVVRERFEKEYAPLFEKHSYGTTVWSPLASGLLTGKYNKGIPAGSRLANLDWLQKSLREQGLLQEDFFQKLDTLNNLARDIGASLPQMALAWILKNPNVSTVILGASNEKQLDENLKATEFVAKLDDSLMSEIEDILKNRP